MSTEARAEELHLVEGESESDLWGRIAYLVEEVLGVELRYSLNLGPEILQHLYSCLLQKRELLERIDCIVSQIEYPLPVSSSKLENLDYALGYFREQEFQEQSKR